MSAIHLAYFGGNPLFAPDEKNRYQWPEITPETEEAVLKQLRRSVSIYDRSGVVSELEDELCRFLGRKHVLLFNSGTAALHAAYFSCGVGVSDEVVCPAYTFFATATPIQVLGAKPVLIDADSDGNINVDLVRKAMNSNVKAIVATHMWGVPCNLSALRSIAEDYGVPLIDDASHAFGSIYRGNIIGSQTTVSVFSLNAQKVLSAGEGGVLATDSDDLFYRALLFGHYNKRCRNEIPADYSLAKYSVTGIGLKLRIHPLAAAIALDQLKRLPTIIRERNEAAELIIENLRDESKITLPILNGSSSSWYAFSFQIFDWEGVFSSVEEVADALRMEGLPDFDHPSATCPLNMLPAFQDGNLPWSLASMMSYKQGMFPVAERIYLNTIKFPIWHGPRRFEVGLAYVEALRKLLKVIS